jgi:hypothetical protein
MTKYMLQCLRCCLMLLTLASSGGTFAARPIAPPSVTYTDAANTVAVVRVVEAGAGWIEFAIEAVLHAEGSRDAPGVGTRLKVNAAAGDVAHLAPERVYVAAFSRYTATDQFRGDRFIDPNGPRLLGQLWNSTGAVFEDSDALRTVFRLARDNSPELDATRLKAILAVTASGDDRTRGFALEELYYRPESYAALTSADVAALAAIAAEESLPPQQRQFVLEIGLRLDGGADQPWLLEASRAVLREADPDFDLRTARPLLVATAIRSVAAHGDRVDMPLLLPLLSANVPEVVRQALVALDGLDAAATLVAVESILGRIAYADDVHPDTRRALERYFVEQQIATP